MVEAKNEALIKQLTQEARIIGFKINNKSSRKITIDLFDDIISSSDLEIDLISPPDKTYKEFLPEFLKEIKNQPIHLSMLRVNSQNIEQVKKSILLNHKATDKSLKCEIPLIVAPYHKEKETFANITYSFLQGDNFSAKYTILPNTVVALRFYYHPEITFSKAETNANDFIPENKDNSLNEQYDEKEWNIITNERDVLGEFPKILQKCPTPISFDITNPTDQPKTVRLFGKSSFLLQPNYGSDEGVVVENTFNNVSYLDAIQTLSHQPEKFSAIRLVSDNHRQLKTDLKVFKLTDDDVKNDRKPTKDLIGSASFLSQNSFQADFNDILYDYEQNAHTWIEFTIQPKTKLGVRFYQNVEGLQVEEKNIFLDKLQASALVANPYTLIITNTTDQIKRAVLFGFENNFNQENYGSELGLNVEPASSTTSYFHMLAHSAFKPFTTSLIRLQSTNKHQVRQSLTVTNKRAEGNSRSHTIFSESYHSTYQFQAGITDIPVTYLQDSSTELGINILPKTSLVINIFPNKEFDTSDWLRKKDTPILISEESYSSLQNEVKSLSEKVDKLENKKWWHKYFPPKK